MVPQELDAQDTGGAYAPMVLPFIFFVVPIIVSVITGLLLNVQYPREQPGEYGWIWLIVLYPLEIYYIIAKWKESLRNPWLSLRYWVGEKFFDQDFQITGWEFLGKANPVKAPAPAAPTAEDSRTETNGVARFSSIAQPAVKTETSGDLIYEMRTRNSSLPRIAVALKDVPERLINFVGNVGMVQNGGLLFETRHIGAASYVRCDHTKDDETEFIPIGVFSDCSRIAQQISEDRKIEIPLKATVENAADVRDGHYAPLYKYKWLDEVRMRQHRDEQEKDLQVQINDRAAAMVEDLREAGKIPTQGPLPIKKSGSSRRTYLAWLGVTALIIGALIWFLRH